MNRNKKYNQVSSNSSYNYTQQIEKHYFDFIFLIIVSLHKLLPHLHFINSVLDTELFTVILWLTVSDS
jgi:hypothetical protein